MIIYIHLETSLRELDSKLLLGVVAASRGHTVVVGDLGSLRRGLRLGALPRGVLHTKSLTPSDLKVAIHDEFLEAGFRITSQDEESGLAHHLDLQEFSRLRYSEKTMSQAAAVFAWGHADSSALRKVYPRQAHKVVEVGSPRVDLWRAEFDSYWPLPESAPKGPFMLVSANFATPNGFEPLSSVVEKKQIGGYFGSLDSGLDTFMYFAAEKLRVLASFVEAVRFLAEKSEGFEIVVRPHPVENLEAWKVYLKDVQKVHVIREGPITPWVRDAMAVMHNGCTTAFEATMARTPSFAYTPFPQNFEAKRANRLSTRVSSLEELLKAVNHCKELTEQTHPHRQAAGELPTHFTKMVLLDRSELAAEKITRAMESFEPIEEPPLKRVPWARLRLVLAVFDLGRVLQRALYRLVPSLIPRPGSRLKFPPFHLPEVREKVKMLETLSRRSQGIRVKKISSRVLVIAGS